MEDPDKIFRRFWYIIVVWFFGAVFSYGHIERELREDCAQMKESCFMVRADATFASIFWPMHWSAVAWKKDRHK